MFKYLKFLTESQADDTFKALGWTTEPSEDYLGGDVAMTGSVYTLDYMGTVNTNTGNTMLLDSGEEVEEFVEVDGFHVNILIDILPEELTEFEVFPLTPTRGIL